MKKLFVIQGIATLVVYILAAVGCTKDHVLPATPENNTQTELKKKSLRKAPNFAGIYPDEHKRGSITGTIVPPEAEARIFISGNASLQLISDSSGTIPLQEIPVGQYTVDIVPTNYNYGSYSLSNVFVYPDSVTNIGTITLEYYGGGGSGCEIGWGKPKSK